MERKIGEIFEYNGEWYQCLPEILICVGCAFKNKTCKKIRGIRGKCERASRQTDGVIFKKLKKVGEPYEFDGHLFQSYRIFEVPIFTEKYATVREFDNNSKISIEIKQTKEDMEEKNNAKHSNSEKIGKNLKPFDLEAAKAGKPVCSRDGRKVKILEFDSGFRNYPIIALIEPRDTGGEPELVRYSNDGISYDLKNLGLVIGREIPTYYMGVFKDEGSLYEYPTTPLLKSEEEVRQFFNDFHIEKKYLIIPVENFDPESL